jgi:hypothetical protein
MKIVSASRTGSGVILEMSTETDLVNDHDGGSYGGKLLEVRVSRVW